ncbi:MAG: hypothetical protein ACP5E9_06640 [Candidatus Methanospirareceae archaeon]
MIKLVTMMQKPRFRRRVEEQMEEGFGKNEVTLVRALYRWLDAPPGI